VKFLVDNCLAPKHAKALDSLVQPEHEVIHLRERFTPDTPDEIWLKKLGEESGWCILSGDVRIGRNLHERRAWIESGLTVFFLSKGWTNLELFEQHAKLSRCLPEIIKHAERAKSGSGFTVSANGKIEQVYP
jgi:hypothetical protein